MIASVDINEMSTVDETMLQTIEMPNKYIEPGVITDPEQAVGMVALAPIKAGEQILSTKLTKPGPVTGLSLQIAPSKRGIAIPISEVNGVSRLLNPGDRIDIIAAVDVGKGTAQHREVKTLMQDVPILATGNRVMNDLPIIYEKATDPLPKNLQSDRYFNTITIEASPEESQDLIYLLSTSPNSIFLTLRHPSDHGKRRFPESTSIETLFFGKVSQEMLNIPRAPAAAPPPPPPPPKKKKTGPFIDL